jgi:DNA-binding transcriptional ArsR family regulator
VDARLAKFAWPLNLGRYAMAVHKAGGSDQALTQLTDLFGLLSDKTRLNILLLLSKEERNVSSLCEDLKLPQPTVSHHLGLLRIHSLINNRRAGKQVFYGLNGRVTNQGPMNLAFAVENFKVTLAPKS